LDWRRCRVYKRNPNHTEPYFSIVEDQAGSLWLGTQDGLDKLDPKTLAFAAFYKKDGPPGNVVSCILGNDSGHLWISTNNGLSRFDALTRTFENYSAVDGLPGNDLTGWDACFKSSSGKMFFGGFAGAVAFRPNEIVNKVLTVPVVFTDFQLLGRPVEIGPRSPLKRSITYADGLTLSHQQDSFSLQFAGLSFRSPAANRYRYKLEGFDSEWHEVGIEQRVLSFTGLSAGVYELLVQGADSRGPFPSCWQSWAPRWP